MNSLIQKLTQAESTDAANEPCGCSGGESSGESAGERSFAHDTFRLPSFMLGVSSIHRVRKFAIPGGFALRHRRFTTKCAAALLLAAGLAATGLFAGCGDAPKPAETKSDPAPAPAAPAKPAIPDDVSGGAQALLGNETTVLLYGDLAKNGKQQFLAANVVPKTSKNNNIAGTIITRAVIAQNDDGQWKEIFRCDEHLKNAKGFLGGTPLSDVAGWRIATEQDPVKGLALYLTPLKGVDDPAHSLPIGVRWNTQTKRYQSLDRTYEHFLLEQPTMGGTPKSVLH